MGPFYIDKLLGSKDLGSLSYFSIIVLGSKDLDLYVHILSIRLFVLEFKKMNPDLII